jgi:cytochrome c-type biogenesis protein CcmF
VLLAIAAFSLSLLGTFLVRSGVLTSVHAFATDPARGVFILAFLVLVIGGSLRCSPGARRKVGLGGSASACLARIAAAGQQRAAGGACGAVLLGTLYPLVLDALGLGKISVGPPYFDAGVRAADGAGWCS